MELDVDLFITIAEIAGIFVGFGALIGVTRRTKIETALLRRIRGLVTMGLGVIIGALIPIGLSRYGVFGHDLWFTCSLIFFLLNLVFAIWTFRTPEFRKFLFQDMLTSRRASLFFFLLLEAPLQIPLILTLFGLFPDLEPAFYTTALFFALFEAAFVLSQLVYSSGSKRE